MDEHSTSIRQMLAHARFSLRGRGRCELPGHADIRAPHIRHRFGVYELQPTLYSTARGLDCDVSAHHGVAFEGKKWSMPPPFIAAPELNPRPRPWILLRPIV